MAWLRIGSYSGNPLFKDTFTDDCYVLKNDAMVYLGNCPGATGQNTGSLPPFITPGASSPGTGGYIQPGQSWLNDLLNWSLGLAAVGGGQTIQGGAINPQQQPVYIPPQPTPQGGNVKELGVGSSLEQFITKNSTWLLIGGAVFLLYKSGRK